MNGVPLRVAMICPYSVSRPGGVQGQAIGLCRALRRLGHQAVLIAPTDGPAGGIESLHDVAFWPAGRATGVRANGSVAPVALSPNAALRVRRQVAGGHFDVVHLHEPLAPMLGYGLLIRSPVPLVGTFHRAGASGWYRALRPVVRRSVARLAVRVAVSEAARRTAQEAIGGAYEVWSNGIDLERFDGVTPTPTDRPTVLFVGRHEERKGLGVLLSAFESVDLDATLWVAGQGPLTEELRRRHPPSERVVWLGRLSDEELAARLLGADVLCAPSFYGESFGVVLLEGMASGCAVVATELEGYRLASGGHARLVPPRQPVALSAALRVTIEDVVTGSGLSSPEALAEARAHAEQWSMSRLADRYVDAYRAAMSRTATEGRPEAR